MNLRTTHPARIPQKQGLYDPRFEHDACGIGFVVNVKGHKSFQVIQQALTVLTNLSHRGATGAEMNTGDGAGILIQIPHTFLKVECGEVGFDLPESGEYGTGLVFLPQDPVKRQAYESQFDAIVKEEGGQLLGWRTVPTDNRLLGNAALSAEPIMRQVFIGRPADLNDAAFERKLFVIRKRVEAAMRQVVETGGKFYIAGLSHKTLVYKGMLTPLQLAPYFPDLSDPAMESALALVHSRFSTNTFPSWERAHPNRYIIHNGEINTLQGNVNKMRAREGLFSSPIFGGDLQKVLPIINEDGSDSAMFDNCLEFLVLSGRSLAQAMMMMIPEPWSKHETMSPEKRAFYEFHSCLMEPWDGPASMAFTDGVQVGAVLDRNGLRPARYTVTKDDLVILASETGVLDIAPEQVLQKGRLQPGRMLLIDTAVGKIISDEELKQQAAAAQPYQKWLDDNLTLLTDLPSSETPGASETLGVSPSLTKRQQAFGYSFEDLRVILSPMARKGAEPLGSMGNDTPLAVLSERPQLLYNYIKQLFAQVTNPPIDAIREALITGTEILLGAEGNLLSPEPVNCRRIKLDSPILTNHDFRKIQYLFDDSNRHESANQPPDDDRLQAFKAVTLPIIFSIKEGHRGLAESLEVLFESAVQAISNGANLLILSDRGLDQEQAAIPALLATSGLHHHLISRGLRTRVSLIVESGEPREVHHFAALIGYGADAINPYLAFESLADLIQKQLLTDVSYEEAVYKYVKAIIKGVVKVISKMGISTLQSYQGAQIFEALGLSPELVARYFCGTPTRIGGIGLEILADEIGIRHRQAFPERPSNGHTLDTGGLYQWREGGEHHLFNPATVHRLQVAVRTGNYEAYKKYAAAVNDKNQMLGTLRGLLSFKESAVPLPLDEVEPVESIVRRFKTGAMSYGSISEEAHETLAVAMNRLGGRSNTGEGGENPDRYSRLDGNGDSRNSAIKQVASGRFGVTSEYLVNAEEIQIKIAQGAKPGEGGQLPGHKVYPWIAKVRFSTPGVGLISPPPHHDIYSIEDLAQLIYDLKNANPRARISVKLVSEVGVGTVAAGVAKGHADVILISGHDGGTGASPQTSIKHAGLPWELGLAETQQTLVLNDLRSRVRIETDGQLKTGRDVAVAALLGAEEFGFATAPLVSLGCIMMRVCHMNTCPVGIATQNPDLRQKFAGEPEHVINFMEMVARDLREWMALLGFRTVDEMVGRSDKLEVDQAAVHWKARGLDLSALLYQPDMPEKVGRKHQIAQHHGLEKSLDRQKLLELCKPALMHGEPVRAALPIRNTNRTVGTILGSELTRRYGAKGLPDGTIELRFNGSAGQSFGAFVPKGIQLILSGDANDYLGKGLSGGKIVVFPPEGSTFVPEENIIIGNVAFYGATSGQAFIYGLAGERFCVRNSGLEAVVEGVGDHGCEYMTGGRVVVLGKTGRNFAAGMSGGIAYVLDESKDFHQRCNLDMVDLEKLEGAEELSEVQHLIWQHAMHTGSRKAWDVVHNWSWKQQQFVKVIPIDYRRMLQSLAQTNDSGLSREEAVMAAFTANIQDAAPVSGK